MAAKKIRCFVAMAFGRADTDALYKKLIEPAIRGLGMTPVRVDRKEHNRNINEVIMDELRQADLVIADLTYARPSVYFEAGFAEARTSVIYTVRRDHFSPRDDDPHRVEAVHFDVSMRNIIDWSSETDRRFPGRLARRLRHVAKPLLKDREQEAARAAERARFASLSLHEQLEAMEGVFTKAVSFAKLHEQDVGSPFDWSPGHAVLRLKQEQPGLAIGSRVRGNVVTVVGIASIESWARKEMGLTCNFWAAGLGNILTREKALRRGSKVTELHDHLVFCSPKGVRMNTIRQRYRTAWEGASPECLIFPQSELTLRTIGQNRREFQRSEHLWCVGGVESVSELAERLREILNLLG